MTEKAKKDILEYLQCMVNTETPTPPKIVNDMLDLIPESVWLDDNAKILCPACKDGIFLREASLRILRKKYEIMGPTEFRKHQDDITDHILRNRMFGIAISYRGYRVTKRSLYTCSDKYSNIDNIFFDESLGRYVKDKDGKEVEKQCFHFIENIDEVSKFFEGKGVKDMQFDVIIGNPPYQMGDGSGGSADGAIPLYNKFVDVAKSIKAPYVCFIIPSRWMIGGRGLENFRKQMMADTHIKILYDFENANNCFPGVHIDGGVCYFLWDSDYNDKTEYTFVSSNGTITKNKQFLQNDFFKFVIRDGRILSTLNKTISKRKFSEIVSSRMPFGIETDLFNNKEKYNYLGLTDECFSNCLKIYGVIGVKGGARRTSGYVKRNSITCGIDSIDKYKLFFSKAYSTNAINPPEIIKASPKEICTSTFLLIGGFDTELQRDNCYEYMNTKFFKVLLYFGKGTMNVTKSVFDLIPLQDFNESWTDEKLYKKYGLSSEEIELIESMVRPMDTKNTNTELTMDTDDE